MKEIKKRLTVRSPFPEKEFESLLSKGTELRFKPRTPIVGPGVADDRIFLIKKGLACGVYRAKGREHTIYFAFPGDIIGSTAGLCLGKLPNLIGNLYEHGGDGNPDTEVIRMAAKSRNSWCG
ncbi:MAG: Crp/Fnr family transcriptional regulator [Alistipes sp.]